MTTGGISDPGTASGRRRVEHDQHRPSSRLRAGCELRHFRRHAYLAREGQSQSRIFQLEEGWACRHRVLTSGKRQITDVLLPGDYCEPQWMLDPTCTQSVVAVTSIRARAFPLGSNGQLLDTELEPHLQAALVDAFNRQSQLIVGLGCLSAAERVKEFLIDIHRRMQRNGGAHGNECTMPLTQMDLADALGLTAVHLNRVLQGLRQDGVLDLREKKLRIYHRS